MENTCKCGRPLFNPYKSPHELCFKLSENNTNEPSTFCRSCYEYEMHQFVDISNEAVLEREYGKITGIEMIEKDYDTLYDLCRLLIKTDKEWSLEIEFEVREKDYENYLDEQEDWEDLIRFGEIIDLKESGHVQLCLCYENNKM